MNNLPKVIEPVGLGWHQKSADEGGAPPTAWNLHRNKPELCPTRNREVVNLSGLAEQRVNSTVWKTVGVARNSKQGIVAVVCKQYVKDRTGVHRSLVVSLSDN